MNGNLKTSRVLRIGAVLSVATLAACACNPFDFRSPREIPAGSGLISGDRGAFVLFDHGGRAPELEAKAADPVYAAAAESDIEREFRAFE